MLKVFQLRKANLYHQPIPDLFANDDNNRKKWEAVTKAVDSLNSRYGGTVISLGPWQPPAGGHVGGKISYTRIPDAEDFW